MQEVAPGHFIYCNDVEFERYKQEIVELDAAEAKAEAVSKSVEKTDGKKDRQVEVCRQNEKRRR